MSGKAKDIFSMKTDGSVQDFDKIIPGLAERYDRSVQLDAQWDVEEDFTVIDLMIRHQDTYPKRFLLPFNCNFSYSGIVVLETIGFLKVNYSNHNDQDMFIGYANLVTVHNIYTDPLIPIDWRQ
jgi:hypothetical protein